MKYRIPFVIASLLLLCVLHVKAVDVEREFTVFNASNGLADNSAQSIVCTKTGRMMITTIGHINFYDGRSFSHVDPKLETIYKLPNYQGHYHPYFDKYHHLWLKDKQSVTCVNLTTENFVVNIDSLFVEFGVKEKVLDMFGDEDGFLWIMHGNMLYSTEYGKDFPVLKGPNLQDLAKYGDKELLLFYENGEVVSYDLKTQKMLYRKQAYDAAMAENYERTSLVRTYNKRIFQIRDGRKESIFLQFDVEKREWTTLMKLPYKMNNLKVHEDVAYIPTEYGYWTYNLNTGAQRHYEELTMDNGQKLLTDVNTIEFDRQGGMWLGTERRGLLYGKPYSPPFKVYDWSNPKAMEYYNLLERQEPTPTEYNGERVNCVFRDSRGWTWVGTRTGLRLYKKEGDAPVLYTTHNGLFNNVIHCIVESASHHIWVGTSYGVTCLFIEGDEVDYISSFNKNDHVPNESFVNGRAMLLADSTIIMQSLDHVLAFKPSFHHYISFSKMKFYPKLIGLMVNGTQIEAGTMLDGKRILDKAITRTYEINVDYYHNSLSLVFSGLNYFRPLQTFYRYRIVEMNPNWKVLSYFNSDGRVDSKGLFHLAMLGLEPGEYHVEVQVSMYPDVWIQEPLTWLVRVNEPWWRTTGVYLTLGFIILLLFLMNLLFFNRNLRLKMQRTSGEEEVVRQLRSLVVRCYNSSRLEERDNLAKETGAKRMQKGGLLSLKPETKEEDEETFLQLMLKVLPYMKDRETDIHIGRLCEVAGVGHDRFLRLFANHYSQLSAHPQRLTRLLRLQHGMELLRTTDMSIEEIAEQCRFSSPNSFVSSFYRQYKKKPIELRTSNN